MKVRCIAVDDEYLALDVISRYIGKIPFLELQETFDSGVAAIAYLKQNPVDLMFLDIQMKELTGLQLLKALGHPPLVIFTTAYDNYAVESYEFDVADYLLKPISFERFVKSADKAYNRLMKTLPQEKIDRQDHPNRKEDDFFFTKSGSSLERVVHDDILYIKGERDYLKIVTLQKSILVLLKFSYFEELLPKDRFCRVHKSYMVATNKINKIEDNTILVNDTRIPIGNIYRASFLSRITKQK